MKATVISKTLAAGALVAAMSVAGFEPAAAQTGGGLKSIFKCDAVGGKQEMGALLGALVGAAAGSNLAKNDRGTGTAIGATVGAAAGSWTGCKMQRDEATQGKRAWKDDGGPTYQSSRYALARYVQPAQFTPVRSSDMWATSSVNIRSAPTAGSSKLGLLQRGQPFQALAYANGGEWILVGDNGVGIGYVNAAYVTAGQRYASGYGY